MAVIGGAVAVVLAGLLATGLLVTGIGHWMRGDERACQAVHRDGTWMTGAEMNRMPCGMQDRPGREGRGPRQGGQGMRGGGSGSGQDQRQGGESSNGPGERAGRMGSGGPALTAALHGEATVRGVDGNPVAILFQVGEVTEYAAGSSLTVKSADGFTASYTLTSSTTVNGTVAKGGTVRVLAAKDGAKATRVRVLEARAATG